jgi:hypothetical protein
VCVEPPTFLSSFLPSHTFNLSLQPPCPALPTP